MRGLKKTALDGTDRMTDKQTDGHGDSKTNSAKRAELVKISGTSFYSAKISLLISMIFQAIQFLRA